jgi:hypothetical protein
MSMSSYGAGSASPDATPPIKPPANLSTNAPAARSATAGDPPMARTAFVVDEAMREKVRYFAGLGVRQDDIAKIIGCAPKTLRKRFRDELDRGVAEANATICGYLFAAAKAGNVTAQIFWLKTRAHWREGTAADAQAADAQAADAQAADAQAPRADAEADSPVLLVLPDNSRDAELTQVLRNAQEAYFAKRPPRPGFGKSDLIARGSEEGQVVPTERGVDTSSDAAGNWLPGEGGQSASAPGVV